jgi:spore coat polysaccharide biosynthesis protein SpsF
MRVVAIVQARMGSKRLPGKVLMDLGGSTVLARVVSRVRQCHLVNEVLVATSTDSSDDAIQKECKALETAIFRGSQNDVLDRYYRAASAAEAKVVVRITADCPFLDPEISDRTIQAFLDVHPDYASNTLERTYPRGLDTEVMSFSALEAAWHEGKEATEREHVTPFLYRHPERFQLVSVKGDRDYSYHRWTLDTHEDLEFLRAVCSALEESAMPSWHDLLRVLDRNPDLCRINQGVEQKKL